MRHMRRGGTAVRWLLAVGGVLMLALAGTGRIAAATQGAPVGVPAEELAAAVAAAQPGDTIEVTGGVFRGHLVLDKPLTLVGLGQPVLDGGREGTVVTINAADSVLRGFIVRGSGDTLDHEDAGIVIHAPGVTVEDNTLEDVLFGILVQTASGATLRGNTITGKPLDVPRRGDLIKIWESNDVLVEGNRTRNGRDVVLWYSERLTLRDNEFTNGRYGLHFMYCDDALIERNRLTHNSVGAYLMYGRRMTLRDNLIAFNRGPSGYGVGLKDMDDAVISGNRFLDNRVGAYVDGSPREVDSVGIVIGNLFAYNDSAMELLPSVRHNEIGGNSFVENEQQVIIAGGGQSRDNVWTPGGRGNYWSDYAGFDADGDGLGDLDYRAERLVDSLIGGRPELRLFLYSPVISGIDFAARAFPVMRPQPILVDTRPLVQPPLPTAAPLPESSHTGGWWPALLLPAAIAGLLGLLRVGRRQYRLAGDHNRQQGELSHVR